VVDQPNNEYRMIHQLTTNAGHSTGVTLTAMIRLACVSGLLLALLAACGPEAHRQRGEGLGSGADLNNYPAATPIPRSKVFAPTEGAP
jgi:hypothetical protein